MAARAGEGALPGCGLPPCTLSRWKGQGSSGSLYQGANLTGESSTLMTQSPPKGPLPKTITLRIRISTYEIGAGGAHIQTIA